LTDIAAGLLEIFHDLDIDVEADSLPAASSKIGGSADDEVDELASSVAEPASGTEPESEDELRYPCLLPWGGCVIVREGSKSID
jgi:hypothetical protein